MSEICRVLVVDDNVDDRIAVTRHLRRDTVDAYVIFEASSGSAGLAEIERCEPDVVILDQNLGDRLGTEVLVELRQRGHAEVAIVFLTGESSSDPVVDPIELGADDYLSKEEISGPSLRRAVANALVKARFRTVLEDAQRDLRVALAEVQQRLAYEQRMIGVVSHDLRTPLNAVTMGIEVLRGEPGLSGVATEVLERMARSTEHLTAVVGRLLHVSHLRQHGAFAIEPQRTDLRELAIERIAELRAAHPGRSIHLRSVGDLVTVCDPTAIGQVVTNLVDNAIVHGSEGEPIDVSLEGDPEHVSIAVTNAGAPLPDGLRAQIFEPFVRGPEAGTRAGLGLGLFITSEIARAHAGSINVAMESGRVTFSLVMPRQQGA